MKKCLACKKEHNNKSFCSQLCSNGYKRSFDLTNKKFGKWTVVSKSHVSKETFWVCQCECGTIKTQKQSILTGGYSKRCRRCKDNAWKNTDIISVSTYGKMRALACRREIEWSISRCFLRKLLISQNFKCAISGEDICLAKSTYEHNHGFSTASLDRIDSTKGYIKNNVQWVHKTVNKIKQNLSDESLIEWCNKVSNYAQNTKISIRK